MATNKGAELLESLKTQGLSQQEMLNRLDAIVDAESARPEGKRDRELIQACIDLQWFLTTGEHYTSEKEVARLKLDSALHKREKQTANGHGHSAKVLAAVFCLVAVVIVLPIAGQTLLSSKWFGKTGTTGIFIAFTGESSISSTTFTASVPFTMCHEIGHRMAFARENEANFAAFLACEASEDARFAYSGYYTAFLYCYNALRKVDAAAANEVWSGACDELRADCAAANSHYKKVEDQKVSQVTDKIYNSYLQTVGVESGRQSYGEVVDLLTAWYFTQEATQ